MPVPQSVRYERKLAFASGSLITTRLDDGAETLKPFGYCQLTMALGALARVNENATSFAVICDPSQNAAFVLPAFVVPACTLAVVVAASTQTARSTPILFIGPPKWSCQPRHGRARAARVPALMHVPSTPHRRRARPAGRPP